MAELPSERACVRSWRVWFAGCRGIVRGTAQCLRADGRSRLILGAAECRVEEDRQEARECRDRLRTLGRRAAAHLREQGDEAMQTCERRSRRCANACGDLFAD